MNLDARPAPLFMYRFRYSRDHGKHWTMARYRITSIEARMRFPDHELLDREVRYPLENSLRPLFSADVEAKR